MSDNIDCHRCGESYDPVNDHAAHCAGSDQDRIADLEVALSEVRTELARLVDELGEARNIRMQLDRELERARSAAEVATRAAQLWYDVAAAALGALDDTRRAAIPGGCNGSGVRRAHLVVGGRVQREASDTPCPGCEACVGRNESRLRYGDRVALAGSPSTGIGVVTKLRRDGDVWRALVDWDLGGSTEAPMESFRLVSRRIR